MDPNNILLSDALRGHEKISQQVEASRQIVAEEIAIETASAEWDWSQDDRGRDLLVLYVRDAIGARAFGQFAPPELEDESHLRGRLHEILDAALRVNAWKNAVKDFHQQIFDWLEQHEPTALVHKEEVELNEQRSGPYQVTSLRITKNGHSADLRPIACWVIGANGRLDLCGAGGQEVLILDEGGHWQWVRDRWGICPVTKEIFLELLDVVLT